MTQVRPCSACGSSFVVRDERQAYCSLWCLPVPGNLRNGRASSTERGRIARKHYDARRRPIHHNEELHA